MKSFGFYYSTEPIRDRLENACEVKSPKRNAASDISVAEIHINLWKLAKKHKRSCFFKSSKYDYYLDFGIKFDTTIKSLMIYLPFKVKKEDIEDLGEVLTTNNEVACLVFNEEITETQRTSECYQYIEIDKETLAVYPLGATNYNVTSSDEHNVDTYMEISIKSDPKYQYSYPKQFIYLRFRILLNELCLNQICRDEHISNDIIQAVSSRMQIFDLRLNDKREIDKKIREDLQSRKYKPFRFNKVHYFFMSDTSNDLKSSSPQLNDSRFLETSKWCPYLKVVTPQNLVAFHWKDKKKQLNADGNQRQKSETFPSSKLFFSITYPKHTLWQYALYFVIALIISILGGMITSCHNTLGALLFGVLLIAFFVLYFGVVKTNRIRFTDENTSRK